MLHAGVNGTERDRRACERRPSKRDNASAAAQRRTRLERDAFLPDACLPAGPIAHVHPRRTTLPSQSATPPRPPSSYDFGQSKSGAPWHLVAWLWPAQVQRPPPAPESGSRYPAMRRSPPRFRNPPGHGVQFSGSIPPGVREAAARPSASTVGRAKSFSPRVMWSRAAEAPAELAATVGTAAPPTTPRYKRIEAAGPVDVAAGMGERAPPVVSDAPA